jgi:predicted GNAT family N-acyltransferase
MEIEISLLNKDNMCYNSNKISDIVLSNLDKKFKISINELYEYLQLKNTLGVDKKDIIYNILDQKNNDMIDDFTNMNDTDLIYTAGILLKEAKKLKINEFYKQKNIPYRPFNLIGLVANNKIECESKRKTIRELCRKCYDFLYSKKTEEPLGEKEKIVLPNQFSKTCIYTFKRGDKKGLQCGKESLANENYCNTCLFMVPKINHSTYI